MKSTNRAFRFNWWLVFLSVGVGLVLFVALYREGDLTRKSQTESEETRQPQAQAPTDREPAIHKDTDRESATHQPATREARTREANIETPDQTASKLVRAWNQGNSQEIADLFTSDGVLMIPDGSKFQSRSEIANTITEKQSGMLSETRLSNIVDEVSEIDADTALVKGRYHLME